MQKKYKKLSACAIVAILGLSCISYPVHAQEIQVTEQTDTGELQELDETALPIEDSTEPETTPETDEADKEEPTSEPVKTEQETQTETTEFTDKEVTQEQAEQQENVVPLADTTTFNINEESVNITSDGTYTINGTGQATTNTINVDGNLTVMITLNNVNIDVSKNDKGCAFNIDGSSTATVTLTGENTVKSGIYKAGLQYNNATEDKSLTIQGAGSLNAICETKSNPYGSGAGIGGGQNSSGKNITINGGTITATGGQYGAGIGGGGYGGNGNNITINGGTVTAIGGNGGAGIGGSWKGTGENITINGGIVTATGNGAGAGIGGGDYASGKNIKITGGIVTATASGRYAAGIGGGGNGGRGSNITISGGTVTAVGGSEANAIGKGLWGTSENLVISGGSVKATTTKANIFDATPTDGNGNNVYLAKLDNQSGVNQVTVDSTKTFTRAGDHPSDGAFYLYLTGQDHTVTVNGKTYNVVWDNSLLKWTLEAPTVSIASTTASTITVQKLENQDTYGEAEYSLDGNNWQTDNVLTDLNSNTQYTVFARYKGNDSYLRSEAGTLNNVSTNTANYTITIPAEPVEAGNSESKAELKPSDSFDVGYGGIATVSIKNDNNVTPDAELKLKHTTGTQEEITSTLLVNGTALGNINKSVATFKAKNDSPVTVSFARPTEKNIKAGTYTGTITFVVSYSEQ